MQHQTIPFLVKAKNLKEDAVINTGKFQDKRWKFAKL